MKLSTEFWIMNPVMLQRFAKTVSGFTLTPEVKQQYESSALRTMHGQSRMTVKGDTAFIHIKGILMQSVPWWVRAFGISATGYDEINRMCQRCLDRNDIKHVVLEMDSPGGMLEGSFETVNALKVVRKHKKSMTAKISNLCASGAYLLASQASKISAGENALIGSIGVYLVVYDSSKSAKEQGITVHVIRSGEHKGVGVAGAPISNKNLQSLQVNINDLAELMVNEIATGRNISSAMVKQWSSGEMWIASKAQSKGLVDSVDDGEELSFTDRARAMAKSENISIRESMRLLSKMAPVLYEKQKQGASS